MRSKNLLLSPTRSGARARRASAKEKDEDSRDYHSDGGGDRNGDYAGGAAAASHAPAPSSGGAPSAKPRPQPQQPIWTPAPPAQRQRGRKSAVRNRAMAVVWLGLAYSLLSEIRGMFKATSGGDDYYGKRGRYDGGYDRYGGKYRGGRGAADRFGGADGDFGKYGASSSSSSAAYGSSYGGDGSAVLDRRTSRDGSVQVVTKARGTGTGGVGGYSSGTSSYGTGVGVGVGGSYVGTGTGTVAGTGPGGSGAGGASAYGAAGGGASSFPGGGAPSALYGSAGTSSASGRYGYGSGAVTEKRLPPGKSVSGGYGGAAGGAVPGPMGGGGVSLPRTGGYGTGGVGGSVGLPVTAGGIGAASSGSGAGGRSGLLGGFFGTAADGRGAGPGQAGGGFGADGAGTASRSYGAVGGGRGIFGGGGGAAVAGPSAVLGAGRRDGSGSLGAARQPEGGLWNNGGPRSDAGRGDGDGGAEVKSLEDKISRLESKLESIAGGGGKAGGGPDGRRESDGLFSDAIRSAGGQRVTITIGGDGEDDAASGRLRGGAGAGGDWARADGTADVAGGNGGGGGDDDRPKLAGLSCPASSSSAGASDAYGGPGGNGGNGIGSNGVGGAPPSDLSDVVYWEDVPSDASFLSPFHSSARRPKYLTFEPDAAGWNNARIVLETVLVLAHATGRTLVLPPRFAIGRLEAGGGVAASNAAGGRRSTEYDGAGVGVSAGDYVSASSRQEGKKRTHSYEDFFHLDRLRDEYAGIDIVTMEEFLRREGQGGALKSPPPDGRTDWDGAATTLRHAHELPLWSYLRDVGAVPSTWNPAECLAAFPAKGNAGVPELRSVMEDILKRRDGRDLPDSLDYQGRPTPVNYPPVERLREAMAGRTRLCLYEPDLQSSALVHLPNAGKSRLLAQWYAFAFFEDWRHDLWAKRLIRDHVRYRDEIFCAAARVVEALRRRAWYRDPDGNPRGDYDAVHVRRGDFGMLYPEAVANSAEEIADFLRELRSGGGGGGGGGASLRGTKKKKKWWGKNGAAAGTTGGGGASSFPFAPNATVYIATDERSREYFAPLQREYDVVYLSDFTADALGPDLDPRYRGMVEQIVLARGRTFVGTYYSTYSSYVHRLRGYYASRDRRKSRGPSDGAAYVDMGGRSDDDGSLGGSYYHSPRQARNEMRTYRAVRRPFFQREFPVAWRDVDRGIGELRWEGW